MHDVPATYDATVVYSPPPHGFGLQVHEADIYDALTTRSPHIALLQSELPVNSSSSRGTLSGGTGFPVPQGHTFAATASNSLQGREIAGMLIGPNIYTLGGLLWASAPAKDFTIGGLEWSVGSDGLPTGYDGWGSQQVAFTNEVTASVDLALGAVESRTVTGTVTVPNNCKLEVTGKATAVTLFDVNLAPTALNYVMPKALSNSAITLAAQCTWPTAQEGTSRVTVGLDEVNTVNLTVPTPPLPTSPANSATGVGYSTPLQWTGDAHLSAVAFFAAGWSITRFSHGQTATTLPNLTQFGVTVANGANVTWAVTSFNSGGAVNQRWDDLLGALHNRVTTGQRVALGFGPTRSFTFAQ